MADVTRGSVLIPTTDEQVADAAFLRDAIRNYMNASPEERAAFDAAYLKQRDEAMAVCPYVACTCGYHEDD